MTLHCPVLLRGDPNDDARADVSDAIAILEHLFSNGEPIRCLDAADVNDDGTVDISDAVYLLEFLFLGTHDGLPPPFPAFGPDTTDDALPCEGLHPGAD